MRRSQALASSAAQFVGEFLAFGGAGAMLGGVVGYVVPFASGRPRTDARDYAKDGGYLGTFFGLCVYGFYRALAAIA